MKKFIIPFLITILLCSCSVNETSSLYTINGEEVTQSEKDYFMVKLRPEVISEYISDYGVEFDENFWTTPVEGRTPQEYVDSLVEKEILKAKVQLILCKEKGIYENISFDYFQNKAVEFNKENEGKETVGINNIPIDNFYDYYIDNGVAEVKNILSESTLKPTENEIKNKSQEIKEKYSDKDNEELSSIAIDILVEEKYEKYIEKLCSEAEVNWKKYKN